MWAAVKVALGELTQSLLWGPRFQVISVLLDLVDRTVAFMEIVIHFADIDKLLPWLRSMPAPPNVQLAGANVYDLSPSFSVTVLLQNVVPLSGLQLGAFRCALAGLAQAGMPGAPSAAARLMAMVVPTATVSGRPVPR